MEKEDKIFIAGHKGLVGSAIVRCLQNKGYNNLILKTHDELDLINQTDVNSFFEKEKPEYVFLAAAKVGGIYANDTYPADFIYENLMMESNVIKASHNNHVKKLLFLGSSCIYPKFANQPIKESELLSGKLEPTNEAYAMAKIAGLEMCKFFKRQYGDNFISCMPTNLYGINDNFDLKTSHVMPAIIRKIHEAKINNQKQVEVWGSGKPLREFLYVDDMADACVYLMNNYDGEEHVNIGTGEEVSIKDLAFIIKDIVKYEGEIVFNSKMKDGTPRKICDVSKLTDLGWKYRVGLKEGINSTYEWYKNNKCIK
ncbi:GDP-L-fucose synthase [Clostridium puniceum]|uniref:GDP-L-fucose synthase n=1 Tax=Clostridium puniceum TaxID=29367 RepID=A0A1S8TK36_9CLOT|nr:GDP-L-fucose synthase [Clostridium puniceum]OOM77959.1 GDP-L-fucose synthase [Clostridium puniceum]